MKKKSFLHFFLKIFLLYNSHVGLGYSESLFLESKDLEKAYLEQNYQFILQKLNHSELSHKEQHLLGLTYYQLHRYPEAIKVLSSLPQEESIQLDLSLCYFELLDYKKAQELLSSLKGSKNNFIRTTALLYLAKIAIAHQQWNEALEHLHIKDSELTLPFFKLEKQQLLAEIDFRKGNFLNTLKYLDQDWPKSLPVSVTTQKSFSLFVQAALKLAEKGDKGFLKKCESHILLLPPLEIAQFYCAKSLIEEDEKALKTAQTVLENLALESNRLREAYTLLGDHAFKEGLRKNYPSSFRQAFDYYSLIQPHNDEILIKQIQSLLNEGSNESLEAVKIYIDELASTQKSLADLFNLERDLKVHAFNFSPEKIDELDRRVIDRPYQEVKQLLVGLLYYKTQQFEKAFSSFQPLIETSIGFPYQDQAIYWAARALEKTGSSQDNIQKLYLMLVQNHPKSAYAADAFYHAFSEQDYLLGERESIKHLRAFTERYTDSPLLLKAYFLLGLDALRDRRASNGKLISRENLSEAINDFQQVENLYNSFLKKERFASNELPRWHLLKAHATLERAKANKEIANKAGPTKKEIFSAYSAEVFRQWIEEYGLKDHFHPLEEEARFLYAELLFQNGNYQEAQEILKQLINKYFTLGHVTSYFLGKSYALECQIAKIKKQDHVALTKINLAIEPHLAKLFETDEYLSLLIDKALIYKNLNQLEEAMTQLSDVVNYQAISSLRLKAMFLRAELYASQGRRLLAKKQLESLALKGGEWALKAKEVLESEYKYE